jgi:adenosylhomocysteinase
MPFWKKKKEEKFEKNILIRPIKREEIFKPIIKTGEVLKEEEKYGDIYTAAVGEKVVQELPMENFKVKDLSLASQGRLKIEWAEKHMPVLMKIRKIFSTTKPFTNITIGCCLHVTKETAVLVKTLKAGGAKIAICASNPLSTQDDVAAALADEGVNVYAWKGQANEDYYWCLDQVLKFNFDIVMDDGADLISTIHQKRQDIIPRILGGQEETTTGVIRLRSMSRDNALRFPIIAINDTPTKNMFDNFYGTAQSTIDGLLRSTNILLAGKNFVICGYGHCGSGLASKAKGMGSNVIVVEVDPVKALQASMDGFRMMGMIEAAKYGDIFITVTGDKNVIRKEHMMEMKDGAILGNSGHFNVEISISDLESISIEKRKIRENVEEYKLKNGKILYFLSEGRLLNLAAAEGHPSEVMDMSFANQALCSEWLVKNRDCLSVKVYDVPNEVNRRVAELKLAGMGITIDSLTPEQERYLSGWEEGT